MQTINKNRKILIGEDELEVRAYLEMAVKCLGYSVELAQDGDEVLACLQGPGVKPDAILLDLMMPNRDGIETLKEIRQINSAIPVIVVSGASSTMNVVAAMRYGATDFLCSLCRMKTSRELSRGCWNSVVWTMRRWRRPLFLSPTLLSGAVRECGKSNRSPARSAGRKPPSLCKARPEAAKR